MLWPGSGAPSGDRAAQPYTFDANGRVLTGWSPPQKRKFKYDKLLPNIGLIYDVTAS